MKSTVNPVSRDEELLAGIVWSDPIDEDTEAIKNNPRGVGVVFGTRVAENFLKRHNLRYLVRGHEVVENGVLDLKCGNGTSVITVFSAAAYPAGHGSNQGAFLNLNPDGSYTCESFSHQDATTSTQQAKQEYMDEALRKVRVMIACNRSKLEKAFTEIESFGKVTVDQWVQVMAQTIESPGMPWSTLQPSIAPTSFFKPMIDVREFLNDHSFKIHQTEMEDHEAETLAENGEMLLTVFKFLDTNGDGHLSPKEFTTGVTLLNRRLTKERQLKNPEELFTKLDTDGHGEISFEEFANGFGLS